MPKFIITGHQHLYGSVRVGGAKNASYKLMIAAGLGDTPSRLLNFSHILDVELVASIIKGVGGRAETVGERTYMIDGSGINVDTVSTDLAHTSRSTPLFIPVLLHRCGRAVVPHPGGDKIGRRPLDRHFDGLKALGATIELGEQIVVTAKELIGTTYTFEKNTHTGTELLLMAAVCAKGTTILENAAEESEIDDLIMFLNSMGGRIERVTPRTLKIEGVEKLHGAIHKIMPDQNQVVSFACAALATGGDVIVENARPDDLESFLHALDQIGAGYEIGSYGIRFYVKQPLRATNIETAIHPGFKTDWQPLWTIMMTQATGTSIVHETVYEDRFGYTSSLNQMGATIELFSPEVNDPNTLYNFDVTPETLAKPHAIKIPGPTALQGGTFHVKDLREGATLMIAGLVASGQTVLEDPGNQIDRGYERLDEQLRSLGATIARE